MAHFSVPKDFTISFARVVFPAPLPPVIAMILQEFLGIISSKEMNDKNMMYYFTYSS